MKHIGFCRAALWLVILLITNAAVSAEIYRWTDEKGQVHFGDVVPESGKVSASRVDTSSAEVSEAERKAGEARLERERKEISRPANGTGPATVSPATTTPPQSSKTDCAEKWRKFNDSIACFDAYRMTSGAMLPEAFDKCVPIKQPEPCE